MTYVALRINGDATYTEIGRSTDAACAEQMALQAVYTRKGPIMVVTITDVFQLSDSMDTDAAAEVYSETPEGGRTNG